MPRFVKINTDDYINLDGVKEVYTGGTSVVYLSFTNGNPAATITCADATQASSVAAAIAQAFDPKA